jgi:hypothetical protein
MFSKVELCVGMNIFVSSWWDRWIWWSKFVFLVILSELIVQCEIANYIQGSSTLFVHFVLFHTRWVLILDFFFKTFITCLVFVLSFKAWMQGWMVHVDYKNSSYEVYVIDVKFVIKCHVISGVGIFFCCCLMNQ